MLRRPGMSRADAIVCLLMVVVAAGLVAAGVARIREAATTTQCRNNLKQLGLAASNYVLTYGRLPPLVDQGEGAPTGRGLLSVFANIDPFIEATPIVFRPGEHSPDRYHAHSSVLFRYMAKLEPFTQSGGMANQVYNVFLDPADRTGNRLRDVPMLLPDGTTGYFATGSYAANGLLPWRTGAVPGAFPHGAANTILFGERPQVCRSAAGEEVYNLWGLGIYSPNMPAFAALTPADPAGLWDTGQAAPVLPLPEESDRDRDTSIRVRIGRQDAEPAPPDFSTPVQYVRRGQPCDPRLPGTPHRQGMNAVMVDGSMHVFERNVSPWVFWAACEPGSPRLGP